MIDAIVLKIGYIQHIISLPTIGIDNAVGDDFLLDNRDKCRAGRIRNNLGVNLPPAFQKAEHRHFTRSTSLPIALTMSAKITFI